MGALKFVNPGDGGGGVVTATDRLKAACDEAYRKYGHSCSHAVWYVLTTIVDPKLGWLDANQRIDSLDHAADWKEVSVEDGWKLADAGTVVVGGLKQSPNGHVIVIYPGNKIASGGYLYSYKDKKSGKTVTATMRNHGLFPRAMSTSLGQWPGAKSKGDKTVWDPWANDDTFQDVKFWTKS